ncbi:hypothetical protein V6N12_057041 [Hibiscus sabdariffa]|uniref:F-box protein n=1 Tax=Hibiscus sabdariffa TaxID=183260 RepID=A0ABR2DCU9_9ROSI
MPSPVWKVIAKLDVLPKQLCYLDITLVGGGGVLVVSAGSWEFYYPALDPFEPQESLGSQPTTTADLGHCYVYISASPGSLRCYQFVCYITGPSPCGLVANGS